MTDLDALLARAVELEVKTAEVVERATLGRDLTPDAREDLTDQAIEKYDGEVSPELVAELEDRLEAVSDELAAQEDDALAGTLPGVDPVADYEAALDVDDDDVEGMDFDEPDDPVAHKSLGCSHCGSFEVDELVNGTRQCGRCGWEIKATQVGTAENYLRVDPVTGEVIAEVAAGPRDFDEDDTVAE